MYIKIINVVNILLKYTNKNKFKKNYVLVELAVLGHEQM